MSYFNRLITACLLTGLWALSTYAAPASVKELESSCSGGYFRDCLNLGMVYQKGDFKGFKVNKDDALSKKYIHKGIQIGEENCKRGAAEECYFIGHLFFEGGMVPSDVPRGLQYLQRSCKHGYQKACIWLDNSGLPTQ